MALPLPSSSASRVSRRRGALRLGFAVILAAALNLGCRHSTNGPPPLTVRVMTFNIHHGEGLDGRLDVARVAETIRREGPDLVALQEVDRGVARTQGRDLPAELAALTGMKPLFSNNLHHQGGEYGNAVLTRLPAAGWTNLHLRMARTGEQRGVLQVRFSVGKREFEFWSTHLDHRSDDTERLLNVEEFVAGLDRRPGTPVIVAGDFNDLPGSRTHVAMSARFEDAWLPLGAGDGHTYSSTEPRKRIDYVWLSRGAGLRPLRIWVPESDASDHLPVVADVELR